MSESIPRCGSPKSSCSMGWRSSTRRSRWPTRRRPKASFWGLSPAGLFCSEQRRRLESHLPLAAVGEDRRGVGQGNPARPRYLESHLGVDPIDLPFQVAIEKEMHLFEDFFAAELVDVTNLSQRRLQLDSEPRFLQHLASRGLLRSLSRVHVSFGKGPDVAAPGLNH